jgi:hypothetical protein
MSQARVPPVVAFDEGGFDLGRCREEATNFGISRGTCHQLFQQANLKFALYFDHFLKTAMASFLRRFSTTAARGKET